MIWPDDPETLYEMELSRGPGDPDTHGHYPGDSDEKDCELCNPKAPNQNTNTKHQQSTAL
jgi:hypothetical protein